MLPRFSTSCSISDGLPHTTWSGAAVIIRFVLSETTPTERALMPSCILCFCERTKVSGIIHIAILRETIHRAKHAEPGDR